MLPGLLDQIPPDQEIASVTADGAFDTRKCHRHLGLRGPTGATIPLRAIAAGGAAAIVPPRRTAKPWKPDTAGAFAIVLGPRADNGSPRNEGLRASKRFGRTIRRRWGGHRRRSRVETKMHCVKLLGQRFAARDFDRLVSGFQVRVAVPNGFTALAIPVTDAVG